MIWFAIFLVLIGCVIGAFGALALKKASAGNLHPKKILKNKYLFIGLFMYTLATIIFIPALKYGQLSILYPLTSTTQLWVVLLSVMLLKEKMNGWKWMGIASIIIGVTLLGLGA